MRVIQSIAELRAFRTEVDGQLAASLTMGALHDGHVEHFHLARRHADHVLASIFLNPTQFNDPADYENYPRTLDDDLQACEAAGVDTVFAPDAREVYPSGGVEAVVGVPSLARELEGADRPGHFDGVCRVVLKFFNMIQPDLATFGEKDYQQLRIIESVVADLNLPIRVLRVPIVREPDGLAMSSRNARLSPDERQQALGLSLALAEAERVFRAGERDRVSLEAVMRQVMEESGVGVDYAQVRDRLTLQPIDRVESSVALVAGRVGPVRLIDNRQL